MTKRGRFGSKRIGKACRGRPKAWRPQLEALESRELLSGAGFTTAPSYLVPVAAGVTTTQLLTTGDVIDRTGVPAQQYRMVGMPDGLGAFTAADGNVQLFVKHEFRTTVNSQPWVKSPAQHVHRNVVIAMSVGV